MKVDLQRAVELLKSGEVVAIPTETVYGLAAVISHRDAVEKIFATKKRPFFDPLIVHVNSLKQAQEVSSSWGEIAETLADAFWPGPLTLVLPKANCISEMITSGLPTVGIRWPGHPLCQKLLQLVGEPVAAPSANLFGKTSPSRTEHVEREFQGTIPVLEGGASEVGIESTIIKIDGPAIQVLRNGVITFTQVKSALEAKKIHFQVQNVIDQRQAPGMMKHHYMPQVPLILVYPNAHFD
ncbi:MAG: L-threonylcarbamoyladenylate synthase, partial [Pseudobdellovibrionaceae bacterium]